MFEKRETNKGHTLYKAKTISLILILSLGITLIYYSASSFALLSSNYSQFQNQTAEIKRYKIVDNYFGNDEKVFFNAKDNIARLKLMYNSLMNESRFKYIVSTLQPVEIKAFAGSDKFKNLYEQGIKVEDIDIDGERFSSIKSLQYNNNFIKSFGIKLSSGRKPNYNEYLYKDSVPIPILLGSEYEEIYNLGDTLDINYVGLQVKGVVIGFLERKQYILEQDRIIHLDRYLLIPSLDFDMLPQNQFEKDYQLRIYLQKVNGTIEANSIEANKVQKIINQITTQSNLIHFSVIGANNVNLSILNMQANELFVISTLLGTLIVVYIMSLVSSLVLQEVKKNSRDYSIELFCGMSLMRLKRKIVTEIVSLVCMSLVLASISVHTLEGDCNQYGLLTMISFVIIVVTSIKPIKYIDNLNIAQEIRRRT